MTLRSFCALACLMAVVFGAANPAQAGPKLTVKSTAIEKGEKVRNIAQEVSLAHRDQQAGRTGGQIPPMIYSGECLGCGDDTVLVVPSETGDGEAILDIINGGLILPSFREGWMFGTIEIGGTDMLPDDLVAELSLLIMTEYEIDFATSILVTLDLSGVSFTSSPFILRLENIDDPLPASMGLLIPSEGLTEVELVVPSPGSYRFSVEYGITDYVIPAGNSSVGIESYSIRWTVVPEPATWLISTFAVPWVAATRRRRVCRGPVRVPN